METFKLSSINQNDFLDVKTICIEPALQWEGITMSPVQGPSLQGSSYRSFWSLGIASHFFYYKIYSFLCLRIIVK